MIRTMTPRDTSMNFKPSYDSLQPWFFSPSQSKVKIDVTTSIQELVRKVPFVVQERKDKDITPGSQNDPIIHFFRYDDRQIQIICCSTVVIDSIDSHSVLLRNTQLTVDEWSRYAFFDPSRPYTRNLIATDYKTYTLLLLCWNPQHESPIHDHPCDGCWLQVLKGTIQECRYNQELNCTSDQTFGKGQIAYMTDAMGYHKIGNPTIDEPAVSLHLYAPPIQECRTWRLVDPATHSSEEKVILCQRCQSTHYSEYGFRLRER